MTTTAPGPVRQLTATELLVLHAALGGLGYLVAGQLGLAIGIGLAASFVIFAIVRTIWQQRPAVGPGADGDAMSGDSDPFDLERFTAAQQSSYDRALAEVRAGHKRSHWMWYIFPQFDGLGFSDTARHFAIKSLDEARAYLAHPVLGPRLLECAAAALAVEGRSAHEIFGSPDDLKLRSCATLFAQVAPPGSIFERLLDKYYQGAADEQTLKLAGIERT